MSRLLFRQPKPNQGQYFMSLINELLKELHGTQFFKDYTCFWHHQNRMHQENVRKLSFQHITATICSWFCHLAYPNVDQPKLSWKQFPNHIFASLYQYSSKHPIPQQNKDRAYSSSQCSPCLTTITWFWRSPMPSRTTWSLLLRPYYFYQGHGRLVSYLGHTISIEDVVSWRQIIQNFLPCNNRPGQLPLKGFELFW